MIRLAGYDNTLVFFDKGLGNQEQHLLGKNDGRLGEALRQVSLLISAGNIKVFEELVWPFSAFINSIKKNLVYDQGVLQAFVDEHLQPGPIHENGQDYLIKAFTAYYKARFETSPKMKSERVLLANLLVGLHEQNRLQPQIEQSLTVPFDIFFRVL